MPIQKPIIQPAAVMIATWSEKLSLLDPEELARDEPSNPAEDRACDDRGAEVLMASESAAARLGRCFGVFKSCGHDCLLRSGRLAGEPRREL